MVYDVTHGLDLAIDSTRPVQTLVHSDHSSMDLVPVSIRETKNHTTWWSWYQNVSFTCAASLFYLCSQIEQTTERAVAVYSSSKHAQDEDKLHTGLSRRDWPGYSPPSSSWRDQTVTIRARCRRKGQHHRLHDSAAPCRQFYNHINVYFLLPV